METILGYGGIGSNLRRYWPLKIEPGDDLGVFERSIPLG